MAKVISIHSFRGGTGKSNITANLAALMAARGLRIGVVDTDIQSPGIHILFGLRGSSIEHTLNDYLWGRVSIEQAAIDVTAHVDPALAGRLFLIPSSIKSGEIARVLREGYDPRALTSGLRQLARALELDLLMIDTHPGLNEETLLSIALSHSLVVVMRPDQQDYEGTGVTIEVASALGVPRMLMVVNKVPSGYDLASVRAQVERSFGCAVAAALPHADALMALGSQGIFALRYPDHPIAASLGQLVDRLTIEEGEHAERTHRDDLRALVRDMQAIASPLQLYLDDLYHQYLPLRDGAVADYIPELATASPSWFSICIATVDGQIFQIGDYAQQFTIQSVSKPFMYGLALQDHGRDHVLTRIGVEPTGDAFNAIVLDERSKRPYNPMVNAGAIATAGLIGGADPTERLKRVLGTFRRYAAREIQMDAAVFTSERTTGHRNRAIAHLMRNFDMIGPEIEATLDLYFQQCSLLVTSRDLAVMAATLANGGVNPLSGERALPGAYVKDVLSVMHTCGMYDFSGEWAYQVGLPAKSGVGGGIMAVAPGRMGIGVFSPPLDARGNSVRGVRVCADLSERFGLHMFSRRLIAATHFAPL